VTVPHVNMADTATPMVIILILVLVQPTGMELTVSMHTRTLLVIITHALITEHVILVDHMDFIVIVLMAFMVNNVSMFKLLHVLLHLVSMVLHVLIRLTLIIAHVLWVIMELNVRAILESLHVILIHVLTPPHVLTMAATTVVNVLLVIMDRTVK